MNLLTPNQALQRTRHLRLGFAMSLRFAQRPGGRVAELGRSALHRSSSRLLSPRSASHALLLRRNSIGSFSAPVIALWTAPQNTFGSDGISLSFHLRNIARIRCSSIESSASLHSRLNSAISRLSLSASGSLLTNHLPVCPVAHPERSLRRKPSTTHQARACMLPNDRRVARSPVAMHHHKLREQQAPPNHSLDRTARSRPGQRNRAGSLGRPGQNFDWRCRRSSQSFGGTQSRITSGRF